MRHLFLSRCTVLAACVAALGFTAAPVSAAEEIEIEARPHILSEDSKRILKVLKAERSAFRTLSADSVFARTGRLPKTPGRFSAPAIIDPNLADLGTEDALTADLSGVARDMDVDEVLLAHNNAPLSRRSPTSWASSRLKLGAASPKRSISKRGAKAPAARSPWLR